MKRQDNKNIYGRDGMTGTSSTQLFNHKIMPAGGKDHNLARGLVIGLLDILQGYQNFTLIIPWEG